MVLNEGGALMNDKEIRLMVETRPTEAIAYIKQLQEEIKKWKAAYFNKVHKI